MAKIDILFVITKRNSMSGYMRMVWQKDIRVVCNV